MQMYYFFFCSVEHLILIGQSRYPAVCYVRDNVHPAGYIAE